jgi:hypothetical protein
MTNLSVVYHSPDHALGELEAVEICLLHLAPALPDLDCALNVFVLPWECAVALRLVQPIVVLVQRVFKRPVLLLLFQCRITRKDRLVRCAIQTSVAGEGSAELALTASSGQVFLDQRRQCRVLTPCAIQHHTYEQKQKCACRREEEGQDFASGGTTAAVYGLVFPLLHYPHLLHKHWRKERPIDREPRHDGGALYTRERRRSRVAILRGSIGGETAATWIATGEIDMYRRKKH